MAVRLIIVACLLLSWSAAGAAAPADTVNNIVNWVSKSTKKLAAGGSKSKKSRSRKAKRKSSKGKGNAKPSKSSTLEKKAKPKVVTKPKTTPKTKADTVKTKPRRKKSAAKASKIVIPPMPERRDTNRGTKSNQLVIAPPKPDIWSADEIANAQKKCASILKRIKAVVLPHKPIKSGVCGDPAPVELVSVGINPPVTFSPPAKVSCKMVGALHTWVTKHLQPLSKKHLNAPLIKVEVMSDYSCRRAYGRKKGRMSEHSKVNALDIRGFVTTQGKVARLLTDWGDTKRDIARAIAARKKEKETLAKALAAKKALAKEQKAAALAEKEHKTSKNEKKRTQVSSGSPEDFKKAKNKTLSVAPAKLGGPKPGEPRFSRPRTAKGRFLRGAHISGCRIFGTILGPEANTAHRNHFHVDMAPRRRSNFCQ